LPAACRCSGGRSESHGRRLRGPSPGGGAAGAASLTGVDSEVRRPGGGAAGFRRFGCDRAPAADSPGAPNRVS
jgi:hypothetical protein